MNVTLTVIVAPKDYTAAGSRLPDEVICGTKSKIFGEYELLTDLNIDARILL